MYKNIKTSQLKPHSLNNKIYGDSFDSDLLESIKAKGIITPLVVTPADIIISGHRRYHAALELNLESLPVVVKDVTDLEASELLILANRQRQKTNEQVAREYTKLKEIETERAKIRQSDAGKETHGHRHQENLQLKENSPSQSKSEKIEKGRARDNAAGKLGISGKHAEKATAVVQEIDELEKEGYTEQASDLRDTLNNKSVHAAHKRVKEKKENKPAERPVFNVTNENIEWARFSWNPVVGCKHGCKYCYARDIAIRFYKTFEPQFLEYRLAAPGNMGDPKGELNKVFVCSMADLFGSWVPAEWIQKIIDVVAKHPKWRFLFVTKNPVRYSEFQWPENAWLGATIDEQSRVDSSVAALKNVKAKVKFFSCEPLREKIDFSNLKEVVDWVIIGSQSKSTGAPAMQPEWTWVETILFSAREAGVDVYFKPNLTVRPKEYPLL